MFICKANTRGYGFQEGDLSHEIVYAPEKQKVPTINGYQIIKETLTISFDGGESWRSAKDIQILLSALDYSQDFIKIEVDDDGIIVSEELKDN